MPSLLWFRGPNSIIVAYGWLSRLWSLFGYPKYSVPYYHKDPKRDHNFDNHPYMMQGCHTPLPPPMLSPLACHVGSCLVWPCCFPRLVLFCLVPSPLWSGACGLFGWPRPGAVRSTEVWYGCCRFFVVMVVLVGPAPPVWGSVFYRDMVWLLPRVSSNVIVTCSLPYKI